MIYTPSSVELAQFVKTRSLPVARVRVELASVIADSAAANAAHFRGETVHHSCTHSGFCAFAAFEPISEQPRLISSQLSVLLTMEIGDPYLDNVMYGPLQIDLSFYFVSTDSVTPGLVDVEVIAVPPFVIDHPVTGVHLRDAAIRRPIRVNKPVALPTKALFSVATNLMFAADDSELVPRAALLKELSSPFEGVGFQATQATSKPVFFRHQAVIDSEVLPAWDVKGTFFNG